MTNQSLINTIITRWSAPNARLSTAEAAWAAAWNAATSVTTARTARDAAAEATNEIQGAAHLTHFYFLPFFGINHPTELDPPEGASTMNANTCEGCSNEWIPGVRFATRGDGQRAIKCCDTCRRYSTDNEAFGGIEGYILSARSYIADLEKMLGLDLNTLE